MCNYNASDDMFALTVSFKEVHSVVIGIHYYDVTSASDAWVHNVFDEVTSDSEGPVFLPHSNECELHYLLPRSFIGTFKCHASN